MARTILITGGAGFIASHIAARLIARGDRVVLVDDLSTGYLHNVRAGAEFVQGDITCQSTVDALAWAEYDAVLHLAAQSSGPRSKDLPLLDQATNVGGTLRVLDAVRRHGVSRFIHASSMATYGNQPGPAVAEEAIQQPLSCYGISKKAAEDYVRYYGQRGLQTTVFRMFSVYGPGQDLTNMSQGMLSIFLKFVLDGQPVEVTGSGDRVRDFIYVGDVADAWVRALDDDRSIGGTYNLGSGRATRVSDLIAHIVRACGGAPDYPVHYHANDQDDQMGFYASLDRIKGDLGWTPQVDLARGLEAMLTSIRSAGDAS